MPHTSATPYAPLRSLMLTAAALALAVPFSAQADEYGRVISSTPVITQVAVPRQVCTQQPVAVRPSTSGAGAVMGAIAGGAMGNAIGDGTGRAAATLIGIMGGAVLGDRIENNGASETRYVQQCSTQTFFESRTTGYQVVYEYAGKQYTVQMPNDPGTHVRLQITPVSQWNSDGTGGSFSHAVPGVGAPAYVTPTQVIASTTYVVPAPAPAVVYRSAPAVTIVPWVGVAPRVGHGHAHGHGEWRARGPWPHGHWR